MTAVATVLLAFAGHTVYQCFLRTVVECVDGSIENVLKRVVFHHNLRFNTPRIHSSAHTDVRDLDRTVEVADNELHPAVAFKVECLECVHTFLTNESCPRVEVRVDDCRATQFVRLVHQHFHYRTFGSIDGEERESHALFIVCKDVRYTLVALRFDDVFVLYLVFLVKHAVVHLVRLGIHSHVEEVFCRNLPVDEHRFLQRRVHHERFLHHRHGSFANFHVLAAVAGFPQIVAVSVGHGRTVARTQNLGSQPFRVHVEVGLVPTIRIEACVEAFLQRAQEPTLVFTRFPASRQEALPRVVRYNLLVVDVQVQQQARLANRCSTVATTEEAHLHGNGILAHLQVLLDVERVYLLPSRVGRCRPPLYSLPVHQNLVTAVGYNPALRTLRQFVQYHILTEQYKRILQSAGRRIPDPLCRIQIQFLTIFFGSCHVHAEQGAHQVSKQTNVNSKHIFLMI